MRPKGRGGALRGASNPQLRPGSSPSSTLGPTGLPGKTRRRGEKRPMRGGCEAPYRRVSRGGAYTGPLPPEQARRASSSGDGRRKLAQTWAPLWWDNGDRLLGRRRCRARARWAPYTAHSAGAFSVIALRGREDPWSRGLSLFFRAAFPRFRSMPPRTSPTCTARAARQPQVCQPKVRPMPYISRGLPPEQPTSTHATLPLPPRVDHCHHSTRNPLQPARWTSAGYSTRTRRMGKQSASAASASRRHARHAR